MTNIPPPPAESELFGHGAPPPPPENELFKPAKPSGLDMLLHAADFAANPRHAAAALIDNPERQQATLAGLRGEKIDSPDLDARALNAVAHYAPPVLATAAFPASGAADLGGLAAARFAPEAGTLGFYGARALAGGAQAAGTAGLAALTAHLAAGAPPSEAFPRAAETAEAFGEGEGAAQLAAPVMESGWGLLKRVAGGAVEKASQLISSRRPESFEMLSKNPEAVLAEARKGMTVDPVTHKPVPVAQQEAQAAGRRAQDIVDETAAGAGKKYQAMVDALHEAPANADHFDLNLRVGQRMQPYMERNTPYLRANMPSSSAGDKKLFMEYYRRATDPSGMAPKDAAEFLQDVTGDVKRFKGQPISAHLSELKNAVIDEMPAEYRIPGTADTVTPGLPQGVDIKGARDSYRAAMQLQRDLKKFAGASDPLRALDTAIRQGGDQAVKINAAAEKIPELKQALAEMALKRAGADFAPKVGNLPRTGLTGAIAYGATKLAGALANPIGAVEVPLAIIGASPRLTAEVLGNVGPKTARAVESAAASAAPAAGPGIGAALRPAAPPVSNDRLAMDLLMANGGVNSRRNRDLASIVGLPPAGLSNSGKLSLDDLTRIWHEKGVIADEDPTMTVATLKTLAEKMK